MATRTIQTYDGQGNLVGSETYETRPEDDNAEAIDAALVVAAAQLQAIIDAPLASFTTVAQAQTAVRDVQQALRVEARVLKRLIRRVRGDLTGSD